MRFSYCTIHWKTTQFVIELSLVTSESNYWNTISQNFNMSRTLLGSNSPKKRTFSLSPKIRRSYKKKGVFTKCFVPPFAELDQLLIEGELGRFNTNWKPPIKVNSRRNEVDSKHYESRFDTFVTASKKTKLKETLAKQLTTLAKRPKKRQQTAR